ncbi:hypothetical protein J4558_15095 [Leptolyngbya sp. 15MV]|nr:hypothetical protein J4558_15095 [Leptolyngbya sp. 15MV]
MHQRRSTAVKLLEFLRQSLHIRLSGTVVRRELGFLEYNTAKPGASESAHCCIAESRDIGEKCNTGLCPFNGSIVGGILKIFRRHFGPKRIQFQKPSPEIVLVAVQSSA